jgi:type IV pilus assembly protein PilM
MARAIGLDIGARFVKVVELVGGPRSFRVQRVAVREIPGTGPKREQETDLTEDLVIEREDEIVEPPEDEPTREDHISEMIGEIFGSLHLPREDVCAAFDSGVTVFREITVPFFEEDQIRKVVRFEAENHLHSYAIDDVVVNWMKTGETKDGSRLTIFASPKQHLAEHIAVMRRARVDPASVDLDSTSLFTALDSSGVVADNPNCIIMDVGASSTTLILLVDGKPRVVRSFRLGIGSLEAHVGEELGVSVAEGREQTLRPLGPSPEDLLVPAAELSPAAGETKKTLAQLETSVVTDQRTNFVRKLHRESIRSLASVSTDSPPDRILLVGGGSLVPGMAAALSERFGLPVEPLDLLEHVDCKDPGADPTFTGASIGPAIGCGLRMLGHNPLGIELLQDEFAPRNVFEVVRTTLATAITLLFLLIGVYTFSLKEQLKAERYKFDDKVRVARHMTRKAEAAWLWARDKNTPTEDIATKAAERWLGGLPQNENRIKTMYSRLISRHGDMSRMLGITDIKQPPSAVERMFELYKALSSVKRDKLGTYFQIQELVIQERRATVRIIVDDSTVFDEVRRLFSTSPYFRKMADDPSKVVEPGAQQTLPSGRLKQSFQFKFQVD